MLIGLLQALPSYVNASPALSTATQKLADAHDTAVNGTPKVPSDVVWTGFSVVPAPQPWPL